MNSRIKPIFILLTIVIFFFSLNNILYASSIGELKKKLAAGQVASEEVLINQSNEIEINNNIQINNVKNSNEVEIKDNIKNIKNEFKKIKKECKKIFQNIKSIFKSIFDTIKDIFKKIVETVKEIFSDFSNVIKKDIINNNNQQNKNNADDNNSSQEVNLQKINLKLQLTPEEEKTIREKAKLMGIKLKADDPFLTEDGGIFLPDHPKNIHSQNAYTFNPSINIKDDNENNQKE